MNWTAESFRPIVAFMLAHRVENFCFAAGVDFELLCNILIPIGIMQAHCDGTFRRHGHERAIVEALRIDGTSQAKWEVK